MYFVLDRVKIRYQLNSLSLSLVLIFIFQKNNERYDKCYIDKYVFKKKEENVRKMLNIDSMVKRMCMGMNTDLQQQLLM